jgi:signal transduction histidine kinase
MQRQLGHLVRLVDDLMDVGRITHGKIELRQERVELAGALNQALESCQPLVTQRDIRLRVRLSPEQIYLHADPVRLTQIFGNLLNNACKYTEPGGEVVVSVERLPAQVQVSVKDTGIGIPSGELERIFELFTQVDVPLERARGGLGIGLTLVKQLVEMHEGTVSARSEGAGRGSEFIVRLPLDGVATTTHHDARALSRSPTP